MRPFPLPQADGRNRPRVPVRSSPAAPAPPLFAASHAVPAPHESGSGVNAVGKALHEFHRHHHVVAGAIAPSCFQLQHHLPSAVHTEPLVGDRRAGDIGTPSCHIGAVYLKYPHSKTFSKA